MQSHRMILLLNFYLWMVTFTYGLECELSGENDNTRVKFRSAIDKTRIRRQSDEVETCYVTIEIDFVTKKQSVYYSDSLIDGDKGTKHGSLQMVIIVTFDQDSAVINGSEHVRGVMTYTCKDSSWCNKKMAQIILIGFNLISKDDIIPTSSIKTLRRLLLKNEEETESKKPVRCFVDNSNQPIECEHNLCFVDLDDPVKRSCGGENMNGLVQITVKAGGILMQLPLDVFPKVSYTCNVDQCNNIETIKQVAEAIGMNPNNVIDLVNKIDPILRNLHNFFSTNALLENDLKDILKNDNWSDILKDLLSKSSNQSSTTTASTASTRIVDSTPDGRNTGEGHYPIFILLCISLIIAFGF